MKIPTGIKNSIIINPPAKAPTAKTPKPIKGTCTSQFTNPSSKSHLLTSKGCPHLKNNLSDKNVLEIFNEIMRDIKNFELESRIEELESKFSKDFSENTFNELKELKKLQKIN